MTAFLRTTGVLAVACMVTLSAAAGYTTLQPNKTLFFGLEQHINQRVAQRLHIVRIAVGSGLADVGHCLTQLRGQGNIEIGII